MGSFDKVFRDEINTALLRVDQIPERVFRVFHAAGKPDYEDGWVVTDDLGVGKGRKICEPAILRSRAQEADRPRYDAGYKQFIVLCGLTTIGIGIDVYVALF